jgi:hypothetical protein
MNFKQIIKRVGTRWIFLRIQTNVEIQWTWWWIFGCHKSRRISWLTVILMLVEYFKSEQTGTHMKLASIFPKKKTFSFGTIKMVHDPFYYLEFPLFSSILLRNLNHYQPAAVDRQLIQLFNCKWRTDATVTRPWGLEVTAWNKCASGDGFSKEIAVRVE